MNGPILVRLCDLELVGDVTTGPRSRVEVRVDPHNRRLVLTSRPSRPSLPSLDESAARALAAALLVGIERLGDIPRAAEQGD